ncbi:MAG: DoxX family protein [Chloroflexota bacterium]|nr:DoxX family protein [Chloroflexota bacterium]
MNIVLWILQVVLALLFGLAGGAKLTQPKAKLAAQMGWVEDFSQGTVRVIGGVELLAAIGLILPAITGILPILTPLAALGLVLTMLGAMLTHLRRKEQPMIGMNFVLLLLAVAVVYGRFVAVPL